jgi:hypothetical protein
MLARLPRDGFQRNSPAARLNRECPICGCPILLSRSLRKRVGILISTRAANYLRIPSFVMTVLYLSESYFFR